MASSPIRFMTTAWPGEYGPKVVICSPRRKHLPKSRIERFGGRARDGVVQLDRALLGSDLASAVQTHDPVETGLAKPLAGSRLLRLEGTHRGRE